MTVVVVGAGLAGAVCAARLAARGRDVVVFGDRPGATALHGGGWYLGVSRLARYLEGAPAAIGDALDFVGRGLPELELVDGPFALTDDEGVRRLVDLAPATHAAAAALPSGSAAVDLVRLGHPFAAMQGRPLLAVDYPTWTGAFGRSFAAVATRLEADPAEADRLTAALTAALVRAPAPGLLLPPVLGLAGAPALRRSIEAALGVPVAESLGTLPSTPGLRLHGALERWLGRAGVTIRRERVHRVDVAAGRVEAPSGAVQAEGVVLATGGFIAGGLEGRGTVREPLAGLELVAPLPFDLARAIHPSRPYGGQLFRAGVTVDGRCRPVGHDGAPVHPRLYAIGDLVGGPDSVADGCSSGLALLSGYLAAEHLLEEKV